MSLSIDDETLLNTIFGMIRDTDRLPDKYYCCNPDKNFRCATVQNYTVKDMNGDLHRFRIVYENSHIYFFIIEDTLFDCDFPICPYRDINVFENAVKCDCQHPVFIGKPLFHVTKTVDMHSLDKATTKEQKIFNDVKELLDRTNNYY